MISKTLQPVFRKDYREPDYWIDTVDLSFDLREEQTIVKSHIEFARNASAPQEAPLVLHGQHLELQGVAVNGQPLGHDAFAIDEETLTIFSVGERFSVDIEVAIHPHTNTTMMGLYKSSGNFCTQCEAQGFRRITYFLDRPDVMARYTTTIEADSQAYPVLLSNGNRVAEEQLADGRHRVRWEDPFPKPSYLFALVAGTLSCHRGDFVTRSGRNIALEIWVEPQNINACEHALQALQKSMQWDEEVYGLEYDLDLYMIVAVNDFNMGAMENKGLNVFNTKYVLAKPETATDSDFEGVEGVIAHEYFHNWTGNRVTCRDWFQLTLKEGLTVFRDHQFTADMTSAPVKRIIDVATLRTSQFAEDAGPMAHPIRPESYVEMNNFYTTTVYNKGAEVIGMYHTLLGQDGFRKGMDLYFERHDGQAVECDDFRAAMADANHVDLEQFGRWYCQAGTPTVRAVGTYHPSKQTYELTLTQSSRTIPDLPEPKAFHIPVRMGLIGPDGKDLPLKLAGNRARGSQCVLELKQLQQTFEFEEVSQPPVASLLRGFSAPVKLEMERSLEELAFLMAHDQDPFNRWDAGQSLAERLLLQIAEAQSDGRPLQLEPLFLDALKRVLNDAELDGSLKALAISLPSENWLGQQMEVIDVDAIHAARKFVIRTIAESLYDELTAAYHSLSSNAPYSNDKQSINRRRLKNTVLGYLVTFERDETRALAAQQFEMADNMTDSQAALACLVAIGGDECEAALATFYERWTQEPLVLDKWFAVQAMSTRPDTFQHVQQLATHPGFTIENPNRTRALLATFSLQNQVRFHGQDGGPYEFMADKILELDRLNPQVAARIVSCFNQWKRFDKPRQDLMRSQLERIASHDGLSNDVAEIVGRCLQN